MTAWPFMALVEAAVSGDAVAIAKQHLNLADDAWRIAQKIGLPFYILCAVLEKEGWNIGGKVGGHNIYGHDVGGVFSLPGGGIKYVTKENYAEFYRRVVVNGERSNGVGPMQLTFRGFFPDLKAQGLQGHIAEDTMLYGARLFLSYFRNARSQGASEREAIRVAGVRYNGAMAYGDRLLVIADKWKERVGGG